MGHLLNQCGEDGTLTQEVGIAEHDEMLAGTCHGDVEFAVDELTVLFEGVAG